MGNDLRLVSKRVMPTKKLVFKQDLYECKA
jgi:hypothetical protein